MVIKSEIVHARAACSDMSLAVDMGMELLSEIRETAMINATKDVKVNVSMESDGIMIDEDEVENQEILIKDEELPMTSYVIGCDGFSLLIIDDSLRHFAKAQKLVEISLDGVQYNLNFNLRTKYKMHKSCQSYFS